MYYYDPQTDTIEGCTEGSYAWEHENRHRDQYRNGIATMCDKLHVYLYYWSFLASIAGYYFAGIKGIFLGIGITMTPHIIANFLLEADASIVGIYRFFKKTIKVQ